MANNNKKSYNKKGYKKENAKFEQRERVNNKEATEMCVANAPHKSNDYLWYVHDETEAKQVASIPYSQAAGVSAQLGDELLFAPAGVAIINNHPLYGSSTEPSSAMNVGIRKTFAEVRSKNSGSQNYTATALGFYMMAFDSIYFLMQHIRRAFDVYNTYSSFNRYYPRELMKQLGFSFDDMAANKPQYIARYNNLIRSIAAWNVPTKFPIMQRHAFLYSGFFVDSEEPKDQLYVIRPTGYYEFMEISDSGEGSKLKYKSITYANMSSLAQWFDIVDTLIGKIVASNTMQIMNGDINKAFGDDVYKVALISGEDVMYLNTDEFAREQIHNATPIGTISKSDIEERLTDDPNEDFYFYTAPEVVNRYEFAGEEQYLLNIYNKNPDPAMNIEITRMLIPVEFDPDPTTTHVKILGPISDAIESVTTVRIDATGRAPTETVDFYYHQDYDIGPEGEGLDDEIKKMARDLRVWSEFDYLPRMIVAVWHINPNDGLKVLDYYNVQAKLMNWTTIDRSTLAKINVIATQRLFGF